MTRQSGPDRASTSRRAALGAVLSAAPVAAAAASQAAFLRDPSPKSSGRAASGVRRASYAPADQPFSILTYGYSASYPNVSLQVAGTSYKTANTLSAACLETQFETTHGGGPPGAVICNSYVGLSTANGPTSTGATDGPATNHWGLGVLHNVQAFKAAASAGTPGSQHGAMYSHVVRYAPAGGYPSGKTGASAWGQWIVASDTTGLKSSVSGALSGIEMDLSAGSYDDGGGRFGIQATISAGNAPWCEWGRFLYVNGYNEPGNQTWFKSILELFAPYTVAGIDMSQGSQDVANPATKAPNSAVAIKLRAGQKYGLNGDGATGQYLTYDATFRQVELWSAQRLIAAFPDAGGIVMPSMPASPAGLPRGSLYRSGNALMVV